MNNRIRSTMAGSNLIDIQTSKSSISQDVEGFPFPCQLLQFFHHPYAVMQELVGELQADLFPSSFSIREEGRERGERVMERERGRRREGEKRLELEKQRESRKKKQRKRGGRIRIRRRRRRRRGGGGGGEGGEKEEKERKRQY